MGPCREAGRFYPTPAASSKGSLVRRSGRQTLHLLDHVPRPEQAAIPPQKLHGLEEAGANGTPGDGEAQGMNKVARPLLLLRGEAAHRFFDSLFRPPGKSGEAFDELGEVLPHELLAKLFLELGLIVIEGAAVEVADGVRDLGGQGDALLEEVHDLLEARPVQLCFLYHARFYEHGGREVRELTRALAPEVDGVHGPELLLVEDGRVTAHAVDAEALGEFLGSEYLLVGGVARAEECQVVEERLRQISFFREVLDARRAVTLGQLLPVRAEDLGDVGEGREIVPQSLMDQDLSRRVGEVVVAPDDVAYLHLRVVIGGGEVVGWGVRRLHEDEIFEVGVLEGDGATDHVLHHRLPLARGLETDGVGLASLYSLSRLFWVHLTVLAAGVDRLPPLGPRPLTKVGQLLGRREVVVGGAGVVELPRGFAVEVEALGLAVGGMGTAGLGALVPVQADPTQRTLQLLDRLLRRALQVRVLYAQHESAAVLSREEPVEERRAHAADVQPPGRTRRVPDPDPSVVIHELNLTHDPHLNSSHPESTGVNVPTPGWRERYETPGGRRDSSEMNFMRTLPGPLDPVDARLTQWMARY